VLPARLVSGRVALPRAGGQPQAPGDAREECRGRRGARWERLPRVAEVAELDAEAEAVVPTPVLPNDRPVPVTEGVVPSELFNSRGQREQGGRLGGGEDRAPGQECPPGQGGLDAVRERMGEIVSKGDGGRLWKARST
jgi:hypothetical protein